MLQLCSSPHLNAGSLLVLGKEGVYRYLALRHGKYPQRLHTVEVEVDVGESPKRIGFG